MPTAEFAKKTRNQRTKNPLAVIANAWNFLATVFGRNLDLFFLSCKPPCCGGISLLEI
jgi:hypothetical protein